MPTLESPFSATLVTSTFVTVVLDGKVHQIAKNQGNYPKLVDAIKAKNWDAVVKLLDPVSYVNRSGHDLVKIKDGELFYGDTKLNNVLAQRVLEMFQEGFDVTPMLRFVENLMQNPIKSAIQELYLFLESGYLPITEDGHFLAYKKVRNDYMDIHSGTFDNSVGSVCAMKASDVDPDRNNTCSSGLHFCSKDYLSSYSGTANHRVMIVKINPKHVIAIPSDYNNAKGRTSRYEVVAEYGAAAKVQETDAFTKKPVVKTSDVEKLEVLDEITNPIKKLRLAAQLTRREVAEYLGITESSVFSSEREDTKPKPETITRYEKAINALTTKSGIGQLVTATKTKKTATKSKVATMTKGKTGTPVKKAAAKKTVTKTKAPVKKVATPVSKKKVTPKKAAPVKKKVAPKKVTRRR